MSEPLVSHGAAFDAGADEQWAAEKSLPRWPLHDLAVAVILFAIKDYRDLHAGRHRDASRFLFPTTPLGVAQFERTVSWTKGMRPDAVRLALDGLREPWDQERAAALARRASGWKR